MRVWGLCRKPKCPRSPVPHLPLESGGCFRWGDVLYLGQKSTSPPLCCGGLCDTVWVGVVCGRLGEEKESEGGMKVKSVLCAFLLSLLPLLLTGCGKGEELTEWAAGKANDALETVGGGIQDVIDDLENAGYQGGPFENNLESARAYLLTQLQEKYGIEFTVVGDEDLTNYGAFAGATYTCDVAPIDAPEQVTTALVSQTMYQDVRDSYAVYFFKDEAEAPVLELCETKDYVIDQRVSLEMPGTARAWTTEDGLERFLSESGAYVKLVLRFTDDLDTETYAEYLYDFLNSIDQLECNLFLQAKANKTYIFHEEINILEGFDVSTYTVEDLRQKIEVFLSMGAPQ